MNWPWKRTKSAPVTGPIEVRVYNRWSGLTLQDWKRKREHIDWLRGLFTDDRFRDFMSVLNNETPIPTSGMPFQAGVTAGHAHCMQVILQMAEHPPVPKEELPFDYSATSETETEE